MEPVIRPICIYSFDAFSGCRNKYTQLMKNHRSDAASAPFRSGSSEEYTEASVLLDDLSDLELDLQNVQEIDAEKMREDEERTRMASDVVEIASNTTLEKTMKRTRKTCGSRQIRACDCVLTATE